MFKKYALSILLVLALASAGGFSQVFAGDGVTPVEPEVVIPAPEGGEISPDAQTLWFVELSGTPLADGGKASALTTEKNTFRNAAKKAKIQYTERYAFNNLWNGFSVEAGSSQLPKLASMPGVKNIYPVGIVSIPKPNLLSNLNFIPLSPKPARMSPRMNWATPAQALKWR